MNREHRCRVRDTLVRIDLMRFADVSSLGTKILSSDNEQRSGLLKALRTRLAELFSEVSAQQLPDAKDALLALLDVERRAEASNASSEAFPREERPARILEDRIAHLACRSSTQLSSLVAAYTVALDMVRRGLMQQKVLDLVSAKLKRWFEKATLPQIRQQCGSIRAALQAEGCVPEVSDAHPPPATGSSVTMPAESVAPSLSPLWATLQERLFSLVAEHLGRGEIRGVARDLMRLHEHGVRVLDDVAATTKHPACLICDFLRPCLANWPLERLLNEFQEEILVRLCQSSKSINVCVQCNASRRVAASFLALSDKVQTSDDSTNFERELLSCTKLLHLLACNSLLALDEAARAQLLGGPSEKGSFEFFFGATQHKSDDVEVVQLLKQLPQMCVAAPSAPDDVLPPAAIMNDSLRPPSRCERTCTETRPRSSPKLDQRNCNRVRRGRTVHDGDAIASPEGKRRTASATRAAERRGCRRSHSLVVAGATTAGAALNGGYAMSKAAIVDPGTHSQSRLVDKRRRALGDARAFDKSSNEKQRPRSADVASSVLAELERERELRILEERSVRLNKQLMDIGKEMHSKATGSTEVIVSMVDSDEQFPLVSPSVAEDGDQELGSCYQIADVAAAEPLLPMNTESIAVLTLPETANPKDVLLSKDVEGDSLDDNLPDLDELNDLLRKTHEQTQSYMTELASWRETEVAVSTPRNNEMQADADEDDLPDLDELQAFLRGANEHAQRYLLETSSIRDSEFQTAESSYLEGDAKPDVLESDVPGGNMSTDLVKAASVGCQSSTLDSEEMLRIDGWARRMREVQEKAVNLMEEHVQRRAKEKQAASRLEAEYAANPPQGPRELEQARKERAANSNGRRERRRGARRGSAEADNVDEARAARVKALEDLLRRAGERLQQSNARGGKR
eukprot:TRINITY_DN25252_c0_g1_i1.p1 TRINITY_DN25252_c0_g1~~TRINITY_DN25252_c0_g1_i1.p1  ORF type:complete len:914 (+),score=133.39 TRINITY_DN25252_c0_g1_i1:130-2871(+)